jgi:tetratricopeptide (TPR) repeat protein
MSNVTKIVDGIMNNAWKSLAVVCVLVIGSYAYMAESGLLELLSPNAASTNYNLLVQGFRAGHLHLEKEVPPGLAQLPDPYDATANAPYWFLPYRLHDLSYYKGRLYLYFGVTPALILFWPYVALTGHYLFLRQAVAIFCTIGFLASVSLLYALWRRYFVEVSVWVIAACVLALGLATGMPVLLSQADINQVAISCGYILTMLTLGAIWRALHEPERRCWWLAAASVTYGLAVGARPSLLFGAIILLVPVIQAWRGRQRVWALLVATTGPIVLIGLGLMLYNNRRFGSPFEFGQRYQLAATSHPGSVQNFSLSYLWFNFRLYFLKSVGWSRHFPFVQRATVPPLPPGHGKVEGPFGILMNVPLVWLALAVPLTWRNRSVEDGSNLRWFVTAVALLFGTGALTIGLFYYTSARYEMEFLPALLLLAVIGILGLEYALASRTTRRRAVRWVWGLLLVFSVAFNLLMSVEYHADTHNIWGVELLRAGKVPEAVGEFEQALRLKPDYVQAHINLGNALGQSGRVQEEIEQYEQALRLDPDQAETQYNLGLVLAGVGRMPEAMEHWEQTLRLLPDFAEAHYNLGVGLAQSGRLPEAMEHWDLAVKSKPDFADAHCNLGLALEQTGKIKEAIAHYEQALRINPDLARARDALARLQTNQ